MRRGFALVADGCSALHLPLCLASADDGIAPSAPTYKPTYAAPANGGAYRRVVSCWRTGGAAGGGGGGIGSANVFLGYAHSQFLFTGDFYIFFGVALTPIV